MSEGIWETYCGNAHEFFADGPVENSYKYCPYCGRRIVIIESEDHDQEKVLYPEIKQMKASRGTTTIRPEFPVFYGEGSDAIERQKKQQQ